MKHIVLFTLQLLLSLVTGFQLKRIHPRVDLQPPITPIGTILWMANVDDDESSSDNLQDVLQELDNNFDYPGRMDAKADEDFRCGFVVIIGVSAVKWK